MNYRVNLLRVIEQLGVIEVEAQSEQDALLLAMELTRMKGQLVKRPTWGPEVDVRHVEALHVEAA
jgi:hypothetical protein